MEEIQDIEEETKKEEKKEIKEEKVVLPTWSIDIPLEINRGEK